MVGKLRHRGYTRALIKGEVMKSTVDKLSGLSRKLNVEIPAEKVQQAFDRVYKAIQKKANI
jgi:hypothetical protein